MSKIELTQEQRDFRLDSLTLNNEFTYWVTKSKCMWNLRDTNKIYNEFRKTMDHASAIEAVKRKMYSNALK